MATLKPLPQLVTLNEKAIWEDFLRLNADIATLTTSVSAVLADAVILAPASSTRNRVQPTGAYPGLILRAPASGTPNLLELETAAGASLAYVSNAGDLTVSRSHSGSDVKITVNNTNTGGVGTRSVIEVLSANSRDALARFYDGSVSWSLGVDGTDSTFVLSRSAALGTTDRMKVDVSSFRVGSALSSSSGNFQSMWAGGNGRVLHRFDNTSDLGTSDDSVVLVSVASNSSTLAGSPALMLRRGSDREWANYHERTTDALRWKYNSSGTNTTFDTTSLMSLDTAGNLSLTGSASGGDFSVSRSSSGPVKISVSNTNTGDALISFSAGGNTASLGIDNSATGDPLVCSFSGDLGTADIWTATATLFTMEVASTWNADLTLTTGTDLILGTTGAGTKIGTSTSQLLGFWNATPVAQYNTTGTVTGFTAGAGAAVLDDSTFTGNTGSTAYTIGDIVRALKLSGIVAA